MSLLSTYAGLALGTGAALGVVLGGIVVLALIAGLALKWVQRSGGQPLACGQCQRMMRPDWPRCLFCGWIPVGPTPFLEFIAGPSTGQTVVLTEEVTTFGSVPGNTVVLSDPGVSRKHAGIRNTGQGYELADLGSTNGVYVNGVRVPKKLLVPDDIVRVGSTELVFKYP